MSYCCQLIALGFMLYYWMDLIEFMIHHLMQIAVSLAITIFEAVAPLSFGVTLPFSSMSPINPFIFIQPEFSSERQRDLVVLKVELSFDLPITTFAVLVLLISNVTSLLEEPFNVLPPPLVYAALLLASFELFLR